MAVQLMSNVKIITSGNAPTTANLLPGQAAFGKITSDGKYHLFGNTGEGGGVGRVVDIVLDSLPEVEIPTLESVLTAGNTTKLSLLIQDDGGTTKVTIANTGITMGTTSMTEAGFTDNGKVVLSANPSLVVEEGDAATMRGFLKVYSKTEIDAKLSSALHFKGTVNSFAELPAENNQVGDVYNIKTAGGTDIHGNAVKAGDNVVYVPANDDPSDTHAAGWDVLAGVVDLTNYYTKAEADSAIDAKVNPINTRLTTAEGEIDALQAAGYQTASDVEQILTNGHYVADASYVHTDNNYTAVDKGKVDKILINGDGSKVLADDGSYITLEISVASI